MRCQRFDESVPVIDQPPVAAAAPTTVAADWCDDADAWNSDDDGGDKEIKPTPIPVKVKQEPEVVLNSMKIEDDNEHEKSSSDEDDEIETDTKKKSKQKSVSVASSDAFHEWKKTHLTQTTVDLSSNAPFPFYYIVIDDEESIVDEAKLYEQKKLKNKLKKINDIDEDDEDEMTKGGKE